MTQREGNLSFKNIDDEYEIEKERVELTNIILNGKRGQSIFNLIYFSKFCEFESYSLFK